MKVIQCVIIIHSKNFIGPPADEGGKGPTTENLTCYLLDEDDDEV